MKRFQVIVILIACILIILIFFGIYEISTNLRTPNRPLVQFSAQDSFAIPENNSTISFAENGTYESASLNKPSDSPISAPFSSWSFQGLSLDKMSSGHLEFSAQNCNVTIASFYEDGDGNSISGKVDYSVVGLGTQTFVLYEPGTSLIIYIDGVQRPENYGWQNIEGHYILVNGAKSTASIQYSLRFPPAA